MNKQTMGIMTSSANEHWCTPRTILDPIQNHLGPIELDPCSNKLSIVGAAIDFYGPAVPSPDGLCHDGLLESWQCKGLVYVNPPYGRKIKPWIAKCKSEGAISRTLRNNTEIVLLGPARTDTVYFQDILLPSADSVILLKGRLTFVGAPAPAVFPSFIAYWGYRPTKFKVAFVGKGWPIT